MGVVQGGGRVGEGVSVEEVGCEVKEGEWAGEVE